MNAAGAASRVTGAPIGEDETPAWSTFTQVMREPSGSEEALRARHEFTVRWNNRSDMLGACLDEYYKLTASINEARKLLQDTERDITTLRQHQFTAFMTLREVETRLEMHSRTELRAAYMGAAEVEMRVFRCEQDRDMLTGRIEMLDGFMQFLSRVIATIRGISPSDMAQSTGVSANGASKPASAAPEDAESLYEELVVDAEEAEAMIASGEVEVLGMVEEDHSTVAHSLEIRATPDVNDRNMPA